MITQGFCFFVFYLIVLRFTSQIYAFIYFYAILRLKKSKKKIKNEMSVRLNTFLQQRLLRNDTFFSVVMELINLQLRKKKFYLYVFVTLL